jgi:uncharacterized membrane protein
MTTCPNCGAEVTGRFCAKCGTSTLLESAAPPPPPPTPAVTTDLPENLASALAYSLGILTGVLFLVLEPYSKNPRIRFHAMQSLFFSGASFVAWFGLLLGTAVLSLLPVLGFILSSIVLAIFGFAILAVWIVLMVKAYQGETWKLPVLGDLAEKQAYTNR